MKPRKIYVFVVVSFFLAILPLLFSSPSVQAIATNAPPSDVLGSRNSLGRVALWVGCNITSNPRPEILSNLVQRAHSYNVGTLYVNVGRIAEDGTWLPCANMHSIRTLSDFIHQQDPSLLVLGWLNACTIHDECKHDGKQEPRVNYGTLLVQENIVRIAPQFVSSGPDGGALDGLHLDFEPVPNDDKYFIGLLARLRQSVGSQKILSLASSEINRNASSGALWKGWDVSYFQEVLKYVDDVAIMAYAPPTYVVPEGATASDYTRWLSSLLQDVGNVLRGHDAYFHIGISEEKKNTRYRNYMYHNLRSGIPGVVKGLCSTDFPPQLKSRVNIAIYGMWDMTKEEWSVLQKLWLERPPCARGPNISPLPLTKAATSTMLVMDVSGSMNDLDGSGQPKIAGAKKAATIIVSQIAEENSTSGAQHRIGLITFNETSRIITPLSLRTQEIMRQIPALAAAGGTNIGDALDLAIKALSQAPSPRILILLSDGLPTVGIQSPQEFIAGPIRRAKSAGICIYTVGLGEGGKMNADLLRLLARESGCGHFYLARDAFQLVATYIRAHLTSVAKDVKEWSGEIRQGESKRVGVYTVPLGIGLFDITLLWPGSRLSVKLQDPNGKVIEPAKDPNIDMVQEKARVHVLVKNPKSGQWELFVRGDEVPEGSTSFVLFAAVHPKPPTPTPTLTPTPTWTPTLFPTSTPSPTPVVRSTNAQSGGVGWILLLIGGTLVLLSVLVFSARRHRQSPEVWLELTLPQGVHRIRLQREVLRLGRAQDNDVVLSDPTVSRHHAVIRRVRNMYVIQDLNSRAGTWVNGQKVLRAPLKSGDRIQIGGFVFFVRSGKYPQSV